MNLRGNVLKYQMYAVIVARGYGMSQWQCRRKLNGGFAHILVNVGHVKRSRQCLKIVPVIIARCYVEFVKHVHLTSIQTV